jgi:hypothetical protein
LLLVAEYRRAKYNTRTRNVEIHPAEGAVLTGISPRRFKNSSDEIVEEKNRYGRWPVYTLYALHDRGGDRYIYAPREKAEGVLNAKWDSAPLSRGSMGLFLEFSNWPVEQGMDKAIETGFGLGRTLDTDRNAAAAKMWAETYGVLGLGRNANESYSIGGSSDLHRTTAIYTGRFDWVHGPSRRAYRMSARGGEHETVEAFAFEAWQAHLARRLYELASREVLDEASIVRLMDNIPQAYSLPPNVPNALPVHPSERQMHSRDAENIRSWALARVEQTVMLKVENDCYPTVEGSPGSYKQGWGFKSLLGAMWLQMMWLMLGEHNHCRRCGSLFEPTRPDRRFCNADCRQAWHYHEGDGKSSKRARKRARDSRKS